jgi:hypothetical protein
VKTAREGVQYERIVAVQNLDELSVRTSFANEVAVRHESSFEELAIARQENPVFVCGARREHVIVRASGTHGIETDEAKPPSERGEMPIE